MWQKDYSIEANASPEKIWNIFRDIPGWTRWIAGLEKIEIKGAFKTGTEYVLTPRGQGPVSALLIEVKENEYFIDESRNGEVTIRITHRTQSISPTRTRIIYSAQITGPAAEEIGKAISADFPDVLKALANLAESENAS
jgi:hypothetical protein